MGKLATSDAVRAAVVAVILFAGAPTMAQHSAAAEIEFDIQPQTLLAALNAWSKQTGLQVMWPEGGDAHHTNSLQLQGKFEPMTALRLLLQDAGLTYSMINERTVVIQKRYPLDTVDGKSSTLGDEQQPAVPQRPAFLPLASPGNNSKTTWTRVAVAG